jgi:16S rRNA C1402 N4-methylase RsmH
LENKKQKQISSWRKGLSIIVEIGTGSYNGKLNWKKRNIFQKCRVTNDREVAQLTETLKQKVQAKAQRIRRYEKGKPSIVRIRCLKRY